MLNFIRLMLGSKYELDILAKKTKIEMEILQKIQDYCEKEIKILKIDWNYEWNRGTAKKKWKTLKKVIEKTFDAISRDLKTSKECLDLVYHLAKIAPPNSIEQRRLIGEYKKRKQVEKIFEILKKNIKNDWKIVSSKDFDIFITELGIRKELLKSVSDEEYYLNMVKQGSTARYELYDHKGHSPEEYSFKGKKYSVDYFRGWGSDTSMIPRIRMMNRLPFIQTIDCCQGHLFDFIEDERYSDKVIRPDRGRLFMKDAHVMFKIDNKSPLAKPFMGDLRKLEHEYNFLELSKFEGIWTLEFKVPLLHEEGEVKYQKAKSKEEKFLVATKYLFQVKEKEGEKRLAEYKEMWQIFDRIIEKYIKLE